MSTLAVTAARRDATEGRSVLTRLLVRVGTAMEFYRTDPARLAKAFALSCMVHVINIVACYLSFRARGIDAGMSFERGGLARGIGGATQLYEIERKR